jgi:catechol 2,3-dioxygenase-like lactoylglutathione lyase family enzyme/quercetin dioxygenase-like cupin family protein
VPISARYAHTNLIARDWRGLAAFYQEVLGCIAVPPERDLAGGWLERGTGVPSARIRGIHLRLPGGGDSGPTLEIFGYDATVDASPPPANRVGFGHIAFAVDDVAAAREAVLAGGGSALGTIESVAIKGVGTLTVVYVRDPEGNIIELQHRALLATEARADGSQGEPFAVDFDNLEWESPAPGCRFKALRQKGKQLRLVEFTPEFIEREWCEKGHTGIVLSGEFEIDFGDRAVRYREGAPIFIPAGKPHKARHISSLVRLFLVEEI